MVRPLTEEQARTALLNAHSEAHDPRFFVASRRDDGWLFGWNANAGDIRMGTTPWVVADTGRVQALGLVDDVSTVLSRLNRR